MSQGIKIIAVLTGMAIFLLSLFPPLVCVGPSYYPSIGRGCLVYATDLANVPAGREIRDGRVVATSFTQTRTAIDLPRLIVEIVCVLSAATTLCVMFRPADCITDLNEKATLVSARTK